MKRFAAGGIASVVVAVVVALVGGEKGRARYEVARDEILARIDKVLGETEIQKKQVQIQLANARQAVDALAAGKIKAQVRSEQVGKRIAAQDEKILKVKNHLATLRPYLSSESPVLIAGKAYSKEDLSTLAEKVVKQHKDVGTELADLNRSKANFDSAAASLDEKHREAQHALDALEKRVMVFEAKIDELKALKEARGAMGGNDKTLAANFQNLEKQIDELHANTEAELRMEEQRWKAVGGTNELAEVEKIERASKGTNATLGEIDQILGKK